MARTRGFAISVDDQRFVTNTTSASVVSESAELFVAAPVIRTVVYPGDDTAANTVGGQTIQLTGNNFRTGVQVYVNGNAVPSVTYNSSSNVVFTTPALGAATYPIYLVNADGSVAIFVPGLQVSGEPTWSTGATLPEQGADDTWSISLSATSDSSVTYALADGSTLPSGISLAANGLISGTLSSPPAEETTYNFSVVATDSENQDASRAFSVTVTSNDEYFKNTVLLLHGDGTNNQNNQTFVESSNNLTVTRTGTAYQGSNSPTSHTGWSNYFDGTGDWLTLPANSGTAPGSGDFTLESWVNLSVLRDYQVIYDNRSTGASSTGFAFGVDAAGKPYLYTNNAFRILSSITISANTWNHLSLIRNGSTITLYVNGVSGGTYTSSANFSDTNTGIGIALTYTPTSQFYGYISNLRLVKGTALYTSNFTPSTTPLTNIANTSLLTCQSGTFLDYSDNNFTITRNGDVSAQPYSPFAPTTSYSSANVGGVVFIPSGTNGLSIANVPEIGSGNFTIEGWFWPTDDVSRSEFDGAWTLNSGNFNGVNSAQGAVRSSHIIFRSNGTTDTSASVSIGSRWSHIAWVRNGTTVTIYLNGKSVATGTYSNSIAGGTAYLSRPDSGSFRFNGYISGFRVVAGTALYTGNFTPPTTAPANIANTVLLMNFANAGIFDHTAKNMIELVGDAKVSTAQYKYGNASMYFDGTGDYLSIPSTLNFAFGTGDITIECWFYHTSRSVTATLFSNANDTLNLYINTSGVFGVYDGSVRNSSQTVPLNSWNHFAYVRSSGTAKLYYNGTEVLSFSSSTNYATSAARIGLNHGGGSGSDYATGYIDDLRITKGVARYTSNFTPPTSAFKDR